VNITIELIDRARRVIDLTTRLPIGITVHNHILSLPLDAATCRVSFGLRVFLLAWMVGLDTGASGRESIARGVAEMVRLQRAAECSVDVTSPHN
jgi:hypothetical protein